uniref:Transposase n=1 Tax=Globodera rostochiensis TaxID=31243 RepID=A0A914H1I9_GLORO
MCVFHVKQAMNRRIQRMGYMELYSSRDQNGMEFQRIVRKIGALQFCPPNYIRRSLHLIRNKIGQTPLEIAQKAALCEILDYYDTTWIQNSLGPQFFTHFDVAKHRTINRAESYHSRQRCFYQPHLLLGRWLANFQELSHAEEESAVAIDEGRQPPPRPFADTEEIDGEIVIQKQHITNFLNTDFDEDQFNEAMTQYYGRIGRLIGFNPVRRAEVEEIMMDESARELAEASLDENGLLAALSDAEDVENVAPQFSDEEVDVVV